MIDKSRMQISRHARHGFGPVVQVMLENGFSTDSKGSKSLYRKLIEIKPSPQRSGIFGFLADVWEGKYGCDNVTISGDDLEVRMFIYDNETADNFEVRGRKDFSKFISLDDILLMELSLKIGDECGGVSIVEPFGNKGGLVYGTKQPGNALQYLEESITGVAMAQNRLGKVIDSEKNRLYELSQSEERV